jgi:hypothetical protein
MPTGPASFTAASSPPTFSSTRPASRPWPTSAWPAAPAPTAPLPSPVAFASGGEPAAYVPGHWHLIGKRRTDDRNELFLYPWNHKEAWLRLENEDRSPPGAPAFSPDGRFLAWADASGMLTLADLEALKEAIRAFEEESAGE